MLGNLLPSLEVCKLKKKKCFIVSKKMENTQIIINRELKKL